MALDSFDTGDIVGGVMGSAVFASASANIIPGGSVEYTINDCWVGGEGFGYDAAADVSGTG